MGEVKDYPPYLDYPSHNGKTCPDYWLDWLRQEAT